MGASDICPGHSDGGCPPSANPFRRRDVDELVDAVDLDSSCISTRDELESIVAEAWQTGFNRASNPSPDLGAIRELLEDVVMRGKFEHSVLASPPRFADCHELERAGHCIHARAALLLKGLGEVG